MNHSTLNVMRSNGRLSFSLRMGESRPWWRDLDLDGKSLYRIGNICDTCEAIFGRSDDAKLPIAPSELSQQFRKGLEVFSQAIIDTVGHVLPKGNYIVALLNIQPALVRFGSRNNAQSDYFLWENNQPIAVPKEVWPQAPRIRPWWFAQPNESSGLKDDALYEAILPLVHEKRLNQATIDSYKQAISDGLKPTALTLSLVDVRYVSGQAFDWRLVHFLLDGHHKMMAASHLSKPITMLSFLNIDESFAGDEWIDRTIQMRYREQAGSAVT